MNVLFLTLLGFESIEERSIYTDLLREFVKNGHKVYSISPIERRFKQETHLVDEGHSKILRLKIGNIQKTNLLEKGISTLMIESIYKRGVEKYFSDVKFDLILYSTPPITLVGPIKYLKNRDNSKTYLLLKDIFPQNAVDMGMMSKTGLRSGLYGYFRKKEKILYSLSDYIGCMSQANVNYVLSHNPELDSSKVEVCPNSIDIIDKSVDENTRIKIRKKYKIPLEKKVFVYGGNLGKPQAIDFLISCIKRCGELQNVLFLVIGDGTEYDLLNDFVVNSNNSSVILMKRLPKDDYDTLVGACDVGLIFLDYKFTIPNFPSRILAYMQARIPILAATDTSTDIGKMIVDERIGWWCKSDDIEGFKALVSKISSIDAFDYRERVWNTLKKLYSVDKAYETIRNSIEK